MAHIRNTCELFLAFQMRMIIIWVLAKAIKMGINMRSTTAKMLELSGVRVELTGSIQERLIPSEDAPENAPGCCTRIWRRFINSPNVIWNGLLNSPNLLTYQSCNNMVTEFISTCFTTSAIITDIAAATGLVNVPYLSGVYAFANVFNGASWAGAVVALPVAYICAKADRDSHTVKSEQIEHSHHQHSEHSDTQPRKKITADDIPDNLLPSIPSVKIDGIPVKITKKQWRTALVHLLNDTFNSMSNYLMIIKLAEEKINPYRFLPSWAQPTIKAVYYVGLFSWSALATGRAFKDTVEAQEGKNIREMKAAP